MADIPEQRFGDFRVDIESRLKELETELPHKASKNDITSLKFWAVSGIATALFAIIIVLIASITTMIKMILDNG